MPKINRTTKAVLLAVALVFAATNPELRALLMLTELMGTEVVLLFCWFQVKAFLPILLAAVGDLCQGLRPQIIAIAQFCKMLVVGLLPKDEFWLSNYSAYLFTKQTLAWVARTGSLHS